MLNQIPTWLWALVPAAALAYLLWRQRAFAATPKADPLAELQQEMLRGLLRKEGLLPPGPKEPGVFACPQRFKIVPVDPQ